MLSPDRRRPTPLSRRRVLVGGGRGLALAALVGTVAAGCGENMPPAPDPLEEQAELARHDSVLATAAAEAAPPELVPALSELAGERARHAAALVEEIARAAGKPTPTSSASTPASTPTKATAPPPSVRVVTDSLRTSADSASKLAPTLSGYRAGLLASIAASCTSGYAVALPPTKRPQ